MCVWGHYYPEEFDEDCSYCVDLKEEIQKEEKKYDLTKRFIKRK